MRSTFRSPLAWVLTGLLLAGPALAADTTTFNVTLVVTKACTITAAAATNVDFGTAASTTATPTLGQGTVTAQCSALTPYTISLNAGANASTANDVTTRRMKNTNAAVTANNFVGYQLYQTPHIPWSGVRPRAPTPRPASALAWPCPTSSTARS